MANWLGWWNDEYLPIAHCRERTIKSECHSQFRLVVSIWNFALGFFWDSGEKGNQWGGIFPRFQQSKDLHLLRKSADALYYILRQFEGFKQLNLPVKKSWEDGTKAVANAFVKTSDSAIQRFSDYLDILFLPVTGFLWKDAATYPNGGFAFLKNQIIENENINHK